MPDEQYSPPYLSTPRALSAAAREFARLSDCLADGIESGFGEVIDRPLNVRRSPERCIIQVGRLAVTVAWIRHRRDSGEGELLIIHWQGTVAPSINQQFERAREMNLSATPLFESVFLAEATCEADWAWRTSEEPVHRYSSSSLAALVVERLRSAHDSIDRRATA